ncbi:MAG: enoyl-CoA hydratase-related protein, partial [Sciscionella sp.]
YGIAWLLSRIVGQSRATDLLLSARLVDSAEAFRIGLVDFLLPDEQLLGAALAYATELATSSSPRSMAIIKSQLRSDGDGDYPSAVERSVRLMHESFTAPDVREGVASHLEKRPPQFPPLSSQES